MKNRADTVFFKAGLWIWIPFLIFGTWFSRYGYTAVCPLFHCMFYQAVGVPCPGCGGTRAFYYLFSGDIIKSIRYHPVIVYGVMSYVHFMGLYYHRNYGHNRSNVVPSAEIPVVFYVYIAICVILVQWLFKICNLIFYT